MNIERLGIHVPLPELVARNSAVFNAVPGNHFQGDLNGHGREWRSEKIHTMESPSTPGELEEIIYSLLMSDSDRSIGVFLLAEHQTRDSEFRGKQFMSTQNAGDAARGLYSIAEKWQIPADVVSEGERFIDQAFKFKAGLEHEKNIIWW